MTHAPDRSVPRRVLTSVALLALLLLAVHPALHDAGSARVDGMLQRAFATFALTRALNGAISVVQGTELALQPAGVGVTVTIGQALDPLDDLVERFSAVMLTATAALVAEGVLLEASAANGLLLLLLVVGGFVLARLWWPAIAALDSGGLGPRLLLLLLFLRLALPLTAIASEAFSDAWLEGRRTTAVASLDETREALAALERESTTEAASTDDGMFDTLRRYARSGAAQLDLDARLEALGERIDRAAERVVDLLVVFVLQTIVLPIVSLTVFWRLAGALLPALRGPGASR